MRGSRGDEDPPPQLKASKPKDRAAGVPAVAHAMGYALAQASPRRTALTLLNLNQKSGFDCPGCAWPEPEHRHRNEYCENGAKHASDEATSRRVTRAFFAAHPIAQLDEESDYWLNQQGRLTEPMVKLPGATHYEPITWDNAIGLISETLQALDSPDEALFYTSGRLSNEAAFLLQLFARAFGTNNLPDCSNMCHESSGSALEETLGTGKGTVSLDDIHQADLVLVLGQNPGTNHPRMLTALERTKRNGGSVVAVNPLPEAGLKRFKNPQNFRGILGRGTPIADQFLQIRAGGDLALFQILNRLLLEADDATGSVLARDFIASDTAGFEEFAAHIRRTGWDDALVATGLNRAEIEELRDRVVAADKIIVCWAMGLTQHRHGVATIREVVNFLLLRGSIGRPGAGVCPVRGHSNVQGDRTMGIWERAPSTSSMRSARSSSSRPPPRTAWTRSTVSARCVTVSPRYSSAWRETSSAPCPTAE